MKWMRVLAILFAGTLAMPAGAEDPAVGDDADSPPSVEPSTDAEPAIEYAQPDVLRKPHTYDAACGGCGDVPSRCSHLWDGYCAERRGGCSPLFRRDCGPGCSPGASRWTSRPCPRSCGDKSCTPPAKCGPPAGKRLGCLSKLRLPQPCIKLPKPQFHVKRPKWDPPRLDKAALSLKRTVRHGLAKCHPRKTIVPLADKAKAELHELHDDLAEIHGDACRHLSGLRHRLLYRECSCSKGGKRPRTLPGKASFGVGPYHSEPYEIEAYDVKDEGEEEEHGRPEPPAESVHELESPADDEPEILPGQELPNAA